MLGDNETMATIAVKDIAVAKKFYEGKLGFKPTTSAQPEVVNYKSGKSQFLVYRSQFAGTNKATSATWVTDDVTSLVRDLKAKGVAFEHYNLPGLTLKGDVHVAGKFESAWFKDPDGNILAIVTRQA